jgi:hypothetical protein
VNENKVVLTKVYRYDLDLKEMLGYVKTLTPWRGEWTKKNLCYFNATRKYVNKVSNEKYKTKDAILVKHISNDVFTQDIWVHKGLPVISRISMKDDTLLNNESYVVVECDENRIVCMTKRVNSEGVEEEHCVEEDTADFQKSFLLDYCHTTHKSQGESIGEPYCIWDWKYMSEKLKYTALSRGKRLSDVSFNDMPKIRADDNELCHTIATKLMGHKAYDADKGYVFNLDVAYVKRLYYRQHGCCTYCGCDVKTHDYASNDPLQLSIDRIDESMGHSKGNVVISCWGCNRNKGRRED